MSGESSSASPKGTKPRHDKINDILFDASFSVAYVATEANRIVRVMAESLQVSLWAGDGTTTPGSGAISGAGIPDPMGLSWRDFNTMLVVSTHAVRSITQT